MTDVGGFEYTCKHLRWRIWQHVWIGLEEDVVSLVFDVSRILFMLDSIHRKFSTIFATIIVFAGKNIAADLDVVF